MGPLMAYYGAREEKCNETSIGPFPYAVGMMQVLSTFLARWIVDQPYTHLFEDRVQRDHELRMDHGEDMVVGMLVHLSPYPITAMHWGWDRMHDLCFECRVKDQLWRPVTASTVVVHHVAAWDVVQKVHADIQARCDQSCIESPLPFEIEDLDHLCAKNAQIATVYEWCQYRM